eukprot:TRINITY_DN7717_c0_g1_i4.p1 TRINITY_DN7717_c0_g1~~TRINITY_DN7717_c0_g1_i4.p1  ORF type:complete len:372 (-),score=113.15 TRINITY_DN7717_c0_g1_i4:34-1149(-)
MSMIKAYHQHQQTNPKSLLLRIYGLYEIETVSGRVYLVVMKNVFPQGVNLDEVQDLKGRKPKDARVSDLTLPVGERHSMGKIKNDYAYTKILLNPEDKAFFVAQIQKDVALLQRHEMMDYSLLIGIVTSAEEKLKCLEVIKEMETRGDEIVGLFRGTDKEGEEIIYWMTIIDCFTLYNTKKKLANFFKSHLYEFESLSTVEPNFYAQRFLNFILYNLMEDEEEKPIASPYPQRRPETISLKYFKDIKESFEKSWYDKENDNSQATTTDTLTNTSTTTTTATVTTTTTTATITVTTTTIITLTTTTTTTTTPTHTNNTTNHTPTPTNSTTPTTTFTPTLTPSPEKITDTHDCRSRSQQYNDKNTNTPTTTTN